MVPGFRRAARKRDRGSRAGSLPRFVPLIVYDSTIISVSIVKGQALGCASSARFPFHSVFFDRGANVPVGLPVVRTSVDHGIACDVSGQGVASDRSLRASS
nr:MAG: hypothetical protein DIU55_11735 [Bacillota bacterium]